MPARERLTLVFHFIDSSLPRLVPAAGAEPLRHVLLGCLLQAPVAPAPRAYKRKSLGQRKTKRYKQSQQSQLHHAMDVERRAAQAEQAQEEQEEAQEAERAAGRERADLSRAKRVAADAKQQARQERARQQVVSQELLRTQRRQDCSCSSPRRARHASSRRGSGQRPMSSS
jgi:hypothetical protein